MVLTLRRYLSCIQSSSGSIDLKNLIIQTVKMQFYLYSQVLWISVLFHIGMSLRLLGYHLKNSWLASKNMMLESSSMELCLRLVRKRGLTVFNHSSFINIDLHILSCDITNLSVLSMNPTYAFCVALFYNCSHFEVHIFT